MKRWAVSWIVAAIVLTGCAGGAAEKPAPVRLWDTVKPLRAPADVAARGAMHDDPVAFTLRDRASYAVLAAFVAMLVAAT